ncbi:olfactory receptor 6N1-like [Ambystoma mexicanum]|uniref:olfactory receptor 6N1-like n=1 Tax=Ambystoma mexicanum TaxID=8296 RepID=UPI0037E746C1
MDCNNQSRVTEFLILGFPNLQRFNTLCFTLLLLVYLFTITGNITVFLVIRLDARLHAPMYFFVSILSFLEIWYTAVTIPKMLAHLLSGLKTISFNGCILQVYFFHSLGATECYLLTVMSYDRYLAICNPLRYASIMTTKLCIQLATGCWVCGLFGPIAEIVLASKLPFVGSNVIHHIFCDFPPLLSLACTDTSINILVDFAINATKILLTFLFILLSYFKIITTILRIRNAEGRRKAFSTCASHLTVVVLFYGSILFMYVRLTKSYSLDYDRALAVIYSVVTPFLNPLIYSLRNKEIQNALRRLVRKGKCDKNMEMCTQIDPGH